MQQNANLDMGTKTQNETRVTNVAYWTIITFTVIGILIAINQIFHVEAFGFVPIGTAYYYYILGAFLSLAFLIYPGREKDKKRIPWYDWLLFTFCVVVNFYFAIHAKDMLTRGWEFNAPTLPTVAGLVLCLLALEGVRRTGGTTLFTISTIFALYPIYGSYLPGVLWGAPFSFSEMVCYHAMSVESIIGIPVRVIGNILIGFIIFGVALVSTGGGKFFIDFAMSLLGHSRGGPAKVSVISSACMASLSGSVVSNIVTTGSMTIPAMKKSGYSATYAGAVEACASTGGSIMPPIMGAAGFLIASFLNVSYWQVIKAAFFPAFLYYLTLYLQVDFHAAKMNLKGMKKSDLPVLTQTLKKGWFFMGSIILLTVLLVYFRIEPIAPFYATIFVFACAMLRKETRFTPNTFIAFIFDAGKLISHITAILAGVGLIVGALSATGTANSFSRELVFLARENVPLLLLFGAMASFVLGIGMTATACYIFLALVLVPALVSLGLNPMGCHLFVLYWGCLAYITPPVALGSITAATIAGGNPMATGWKSMRLGMAKYIVPFFFVLDPALIFQSSPLVIVQAVISATIGCILLAGSLEGWLYYFGDFKSFYHRALAFITGALLMYPHVYAAFAGGALLLLFTILSRKKKFDENILMESQPEPNAK